MSETYQHSWDLSVVEALAVQKNLSQRVICRKDFGAVNRVAGLDVGFEQGGKVTRAAVVVLSYPDLILVERVLVRQPTRFPYVPGLLSFREAPAILEALSQLSQSPDLLLCDGQGRAHPRRCGLACHLGLLSGIPSIGAAKSRLCGKSAPLGEQRGDWQPLLDGDEVIGVVLRTRQGVKPLYISIGHRIDLLSAIEYVLACTPRYRLPETTRQAHHLASRE